MKLKPGLAAFYAIWPGNRSGLFDSSRACTSVYKYNTACKLYGYERISQVLVQVKEQETRVPYRGKLPYRQ